MSALDGLALAVYAALVLWIGGRARRRDADADELALGSRRLPAGAVGVSMVATELSAATFIGVPHAAFGGDWFFLQFAFGALAAKVLLARYVIPLYHRMGIVTVYGFLEDRFGPATRRSAAACFVAGRIGASGVRLFIAALAFAAVTGISLELSVALSALVAGLYTRSGGIRAVVWTDVLQAGVFLAGAGAAVWALAAAADGGLAEIVAWGRAQGRFRVFHAAPWLSLSDSRALGVALVGGFFLTLATHSTDYDMVQRLLTTRSGRAGGRALVASALVNFPVTALFLFVGTGLAWFYATPRGYELVDASRVLPVFALHELPSGLRGLLFAGLFAAAMSSLDSAICAIATTWCVDVRPGPEAALAPRIRRASAGVALALAASALAMAAYQRALAGPDAAGPSLLELALSAMTILYGGLLGVFAVGLLDRRRGGDRAAVCGLLAGGAFGLALFLHPLWLGDAALAWPWWIPLAATGSAGLAWAGRRASPPARGA